MDAKSVGECSPRKRIMDAKNQDKEVRRSGLKVLSAGGRRSRRATPARWIDCSFRLSTHGVGARGRTHCCVLGGWRQVSMVLDGRGGTPLPRLPHGDDDEDDYQVSGPGTNER